MLIRVKGFPQVKSRVDKAVWSNKWNKVGGRDSCCHQMRMMLERKCDSTAEQDPGAMLVAGTQCFTNHKFWLYLHGAYRLAGKNKH